MPDRISPSCLCLLNSRPQQTSRALPAMLHSNRTIPSTYRDPGKSSQKKSNPTAVLKVRNVPTSAYTRACQQPRQLHAHPRETPFLSPLQYIVGLRSHLSLYLVVACSSSPPRYKTDEAFSTPPSKSTSSNPKQATTPPHPSTSQIEA